MSIDYRARYNEANNFKNAPYIAEDQQQEQVTKLTDAQRTTWSKGFESLDVKATAFIYEHRNKLRYVASNASWLYWDGHVWKWDTTGRAQEMVKEFGRDHSYPVSGESDEAKKARLGWYRLLTSPKGISDVLSLAKTDALMVATPEQFDAATTELNTPAGVVNLRTGELTAPTPEKLVKRSTTVAPDSNCPTPIYDRLLSEAFFGRPELSAYFEAMMGVTLLKGQQEQVFLYMFGKAGSGKGTLMNVAKEILGTGETGYTAYVDADMFVSSRMKQHPTEMMQFLGARMVISSEITQGQKMDTGKLKRTTGGDSITGRYMGKDYVTFDPTHTLWLMANDRLQVPHDDQGVWRRLRVIPFDFAKKESEQIGGLIDRLKAEYPGILARWIAKTTQYINEGLSTPSVVMDAREDYVKDQDTVAEWLEACADVDIPEAFTSTEALRDSYIKWCAREKRTALGSRKFSQDLIGKGYESTKAYVKDTPTGPARQMRGFRGVSILSSVLTVSN